ncbi:hypothetical protein ABPG72_018188 [Tetrahymena utriculariae]
MEFQTNQKRQKSKKPQLNLEAFECKLLQKIDLNTEKYADNPTQDSVQKTLNIGSAWSGINIRSDQKPIFFYGTENGFAVKLSIEKIQSKKKQYENQNNVFKIFDYEIENKVQSESENQVCKIDDKKSNLNIQILKLYDSDYPCLQIGQFNNNNVAISTRQQGFYQLHILNQNFERIFLVENPFFAMQFAKSKNNIIIFKEKKSQTSFLRFGKIENNKFKYYDRQIHLLDQVTCLYVYEDFLFIGLYNKQVSVYSIKYRRIIKNIDPQTQLSIKRIIYVPQNKMIAVVSTSDELSFIDYITGKVIQQYRISDIFQQEKLDCSSSVQIFLFNFVNPEVVLIGGSFPYLFFFEWQSGKVLKKYKDQSQFVGSFIHNNLLYLTHEKVSHITILY